MFLRCSLVIVFQWEVKNGNTAYMFDTRILFHEELPRSIISTCTYDSHLKKKKKKGKRKKKCVRVLNSFFFF